jgi:amidophosphoribosyltransferase
MYPCFYGVDFPTKEELVANNRTIEQIRDFLEVDSLGYISLEGMLSAHRCQMNISARLLEWKYPVPVTTIVSKF